MSVASPFYRRLLPAVFFVHSTPVVFQEVFRKDAVSRLALFRTDIPSLPCAKKSTASAALVSFIPAILPVLFAPVGTSFRKRKQQRHHNQKSQQQKGDAIQAVHGQPCPGVQIATSLELTFLGSRPAAKKVSAIRCCSPNASSLMARTS